MALPRAHRAAPACTRSVEIELASTEVRRRLSPIGEAETVAAVGFDLGRTLRLARLRLRRCGHPLGEGGAAEAEQGRGSAGCGRSGQGFLRRRVSSRNCILAAPRLRLFREPPLDSHPPTLPQLHRRHRCASGARRSGRSHPQPARSSAIVGRSGSGKSTLLNLVSGIDRPDSGEVAVGGRIVSAMQGAGAHAFPAHARRLRLSVLQSHTHARC